MGQRKECTGTRACSLTAMGRCSALPRQESHGPEHHTDLPLGQAPHGPGRTGLWQAVGFPLHHPAPPRHPLQSTLSKISGEDIKVTCQAEGAKHHVEGEGLPLHLAGEEVLLSKEYGGTGLRWFSSGQDSQPPSASPSPPDTEKYQERIWMQTKGFRQPKPEQHIFLF